MNAPKFPIYIVTLLFVVGMLIPPWTENECLIWSSVIIPFLGALFKKYRVLAYLVFLPLGNIHYQQFYRPSKSNYSYFTTTENKKTLLVKLTQALKPNDFQFRFYGRVVQVGDQKTEGKILVLIQREALKKTPLSGDFILTQKILKPILLGKRDALDRELVQAYADAGVVHI
jgi:predicted membrane metal-binding protein